MRVADEHRNTDSGMNIRDYARIIWRKRWFVILPLLTAGIVVAIGVRFLRPIYMSSSVIKLEHQQVVSPEVAQIMQIENRRRQLDNETLVQLRTELASTGFVDQIIRHFRLDKNPRVLEEALKDQQERYPALTVEEVAYRRLREIIREKVMVKNAGPAMFEIQCFDYNADNAYFLAETITDLYIQKEKRDRLEGVQQAGEFSDEQLAIYKEQLEQAEQELERVKRRISQGEVTGNPVDATNLRAAESLHGSLKIRVQEAEGLVSDVRDHVAEQLGAVPSSDKIWKDPDLLNLQNRLIAQREGEGLLEISGGEGSGSELQKTREDIMGLEGDIQRYLTNLVRLNYPDTPADYRPLMVEYFFQLVRLSSLKEKRDKLSYYISTFKQRLALKPQLEVDLVKVTQEVETKRALYESFLKAKTSTQISEAAQSTDLAPPVEIVETPKRPLLPARPNKMKIFLFGLLFGGVIGVAGLFATEYFDVSYRNIADIEAALGVPVVGTIPHFDRIGRFKQNRSRTKTVVLLATLLGVVFISIAGFYVYGKLSDRKVMDIQTSTAKETQG